MSVGDLVTQWTGGTPIASIGEGRGEPVLAAEMKRVVGAFDVQRSAFLASINSLEQMAEDTLALIKSTDSDWKRGALEGEAMGYERAARALGHVWNRIGVEGRDDGEAG